ncbi:MAG TPA: hypothetical protein VI195_07260 [Steroidobacteraceae bacterium]
MSDPPAIVGTWVVQAPSAPFPLHLFVFHSDGTVQQSNPDAGDPHTSDSNAMGVWVGDGDRIRGKLVEITADRATHQFVSRGEIAFSLEVTGNEFRGTASANFYDANGQLLRGPVQTPLAGQRILP